VSRCVQLWHGRMTDRIPGVCAAFVGQRGAVAGAEGLLDVLAGDLVAAGYAVGVDSEPDSHAVPGASRDLGGRGAGGQPQRQCGMAQIVGAAHRPGACPVLRHGRGAGLVPDPAVEAFAERAAAGTPEQSPIFGAPERAVLRWPIAIGRRLER